MKTRWLGRIKVDPSVCHGTACISGTRIPVSVVLDCMAEGMTEDEIIDEYPSLRPDDLKAAIEYGAQLAREEIRPLVKQR
jgi:uncharacterized protein (DUF433 family)